MRDEWREHPSFPGYLFSLEGKAARRLQSGKLRILSGCSCGAGYRAISAAIGGNRYRRIYIHRGVCELFNGSCPPGLECRHINGNMHDNRAANLQWGTPAENTSDKKRHGTVTKGEKNGGAKLTSEEVFDMRKLRAELGVTFRSLAIRFGVSTMTAYRATVGHTWNLKTFTRPL